MLSVVRRALLDAVYQHIIFTLLLFIEVDTLALLRLCCSDHLYFTLEFVVVLAPDPYARMLLSLLYSSFWIYVSCKINIKLVLCLNECDQNNAMWQRK